MYQIIRAYNDCTSMSEHTDSICDAFAACSIYLADPDCTRIIIYDTKTGKTITDFHRN